MIAGVLVVGYRNLTGKVKGIRIGPKPPAFISPGGVQGASEYL
jgi:hypothetical protein